MDLFGVTCAFLDLYCMDLLNFNIGYINFNELSLLDLYYMKHTRVYYTINGSCGSEIINWVFHPRLVIYLL